MRLNNSFNYSNPKIPNSAPQPSVEAHMRYFTFADTRLILKLLQCVVSFTTWALAERTVHYWWASLLWRRMVQARLTQRFTAATQMISRVSVSRGWERFRGRERMSYLSSEASPCNCYCVLTCRHMHVCMTLVLNVHFNGLDHSEIKFLPVLFDQRHIMLLWNTKVNILKILQVALFHDWRMRLFEHRKGLQSTIKVA